MRETSTPPLGQGHGQQLGGATAPEEQDLAGQAPGQAQQVHGLASALAAAQGPHLVADVQLQVAPGDDRAAVAGHGPDQEVPGDVVLLGHLEQGATDERRRLGEGGPEHHDLPAGEVLDLAGAGELEQLGDVAGRLLVRVDDQVGADGVAQLVGVDAPQLGGLDPDHGALHAPLLGHQRGDHVDLVGVGDRHQQLGPVEAGQLEGAGVAAAALDGHHVQLLGHGAQASGVALDQGHVHTLPGEPVGHVRAHLAGTDDDHVHVHILSHPAGPVAIRARPTPDARRPAADARRPAGRPP